MNFENSWLARPYVRIGAEVKEHHLSARMQNYKLGQVPVEAKLMTAAVDVQGDSFPVVIRAWGDYMTSRLVYADYLYSWAEVYEKIIESFYPRLDESEQVGVRLAGFDTGYRTHEVYRFVEEITGSGRARCIKGFQNLRGELFKAGKMGVNPNTGKKYKYGMRLWQVDVNIFKDMLTNLIHGKSGDISGWYLPKNPSSRYLYQMRSERKEIAEHPKSGQVTEKWIRKHVNDYWDCEVYNLALAHMLGVQHLRPEGEVPKTLGIEKPQKPGQVREKRKRRPGGMLGDRGRGFGRRIRER